MITYQLYKAPIEVLQEYETVLANKIGDRGGIYILHKGKNIYYIGKATQLRRRIKQHFFDKHGRKWDTFSLYVVENNDFLDSLERMLVTLVRPKGNSTLFKTEAKYKKDLAKEIELLQRQHIKKLFSDVYDRRKKFRTLVKTYKGKKLEAILQQDGTVLYKNKKFTSLTALTKHITGIKSISGPRFWGFTKP